MDKDVVHIYNGILFRHNKETNPTIFNNMDGAGGHILSEISQVEKDKCQMISLICGVYNNEANLKEQNGSRLRDSKKGLVVTKEEGCGRVDGEGGRRGLRGIMFSTHGVGGYREKSVAQSRHIVNLWHLTTLMDSACISVWVGT